MVNSKSKEELLFAFGFDAPMTWKRRLYQSAGYFTTRFMDLGDKIIHMTHEHTRCLGCSNVRNDPHEDGCPSIEQDRFNN